MLFLFAIIIIPLTQEISAYRLALALSVFVEAIKTLEIGDWFRRNWTMRNDKERQGGQQQLDCLFLLLYLGKIADVGTVEGEGGVRKVENVCNVRVCVCIQWE